MSKSQKFILPIHQIMVDAGYKNMYYRTSPNHPYIHYGCDYSSQKDSKFEVFASGDGKVIACGKDTGTLCYVAVIRYNTVFIHKTGQVKDLILRYYHMESIRIKTGQTVKRGDVIGIVGNTITGLKHVHVEVDTDTASPCYSPQVTGGKIIKRGIDSTINPSFVFYEGKSQSVKAYANNKYTVDTDLRFPKESETQMQKLILPINNSIVSAGYKNAKYAAKFGFKHYGLDVYGSSQIYASGDGVVISCGTDTILGNVVVVRYNQSLIHSTGDVKNLVVRIYHMKSISVKKGQKVNKDTLLGVMGNTGSYSQGVHAHIEVDTDTAYPCYSPTLNKSSNIIKKGTDSTINPATVFHIKSSPPDNQTIRRLYDGYSTNEDTNMCEMK